MSVWFDKTHSIRCFKLNLISIFKFDNLSQQPITFNNNDFPALVDSKQNTLSIESFFIDSSDVKYIMIQYTLIHLSGCLAELVSLNLPNFSMNSNRLILIYKLFFTISKTKLTVIQKVFHIVIFLPVIGNIILHISNQGSSPILSTSPLTQVSFPYLCA